MDSAPHSYILTVSCPDGVGLVAAVSGLIASWGGWLTEVSNHSDRATNRFFMRNVVAADSLPFGIEEFRSGFLPLARRHQMEFAVRDSSVAKRVVILVSREGHCLADLLHRWRTGELRFDLQGRRLEPRDGARGRRAAGRPVPSRAGPERREGAGLRDDRAHLRDRAGRAGRARTLHADPAGEPLPALRRADREHPPRLPAVLRRQPALPAGLRLRGEADRGHAATSSRPISTRDRSSSRT